MKFFLRLAVWATAVLLLWLVLRAVPLAATWAVLRRLEVGHLALLVLANVGVLLLLNGRWWLILRGQGHSIPYLTLTAYRLASTSFSYVTPGPQFGGEPLQVLLIERNYKVPRATAVAAVALDKTLELIINFTYLLGGILFIWQTKLLGATAGWQMVALALLLFLLPLGLLLNFWWQWHWLSRLAHLPMRLLQRSSWRDAAQRLYDALRAIEKQLADLCHQQPRLLMLATFVSVLAWLAVMAEFWLMILLLGVEVSFLQMVVILTAARVALLLPLPGGLGTLEASQLFAFTLFGFEPAAALSFSLLVRARDVLLVCLGLWVAKAALAPVPPS